jgi:hypothetical protein
MKSSNNKSSSNSGSGNDTGKPDRLLILLSKIGLVIITVLIIVGIYLIFFKNKTYESNFECFQNPGQSSQPSPTLSMKNETIYEKSLKELYPDNQRLICSLVPGMANNNICFADNESYVLYNFPVHMIKLPDAGILSVFNDGRLYKKDSIGNTMWQGPLDNSLPADTIPLRMVTLSNDLKTLLGVGYDNKLYRKAPDSKGNLNLEGVWQMVPNNTNIIYVLYDNESNSLISIDIYGKLLIKPAGNDLTLQSRELINRINRPILRMYYDINGYVLVIDNKFDLYQLSELAWKNSPINSQRGANNSKLLDVMYNNDGTMYGLVFNKDSFMVQTKKQVQAWYLGDFIDLDDQVNIANSSSGESNFVMSDLDIIQSKTGSISEYLKFVDADEHSDEDPNMAYQKQLFETRAKLKEFCNSRYSTTDTNYENWNLYSTVENNDIRINDMKNVINNLLKYEPDKERIIDKNPIITKPIS